MPKKLASPTDARASVLGALGLAVMGEVGEFGVKDVVKRSSIDSGAPSTDGGCTLLPLSPIRCEESVGTK
jgi:hypothetical protein